MAISPQCTVNTLTTEDGVDVTGGTEVTIQLADLAGVYAWSIQCITTDDANDKDTINADLSINNVTKTATFTAPLVPNGSAIIFESKVNNGRDNNSRIDPTLTTRFKVAVLSGGGNRVVAVDEHMENHHTYGWTPIINDLVRNSVISIGGLAGAGLYYSGGMYNVGAANDSITINADSIELKAAYKTLLDGATSSATSSTLAKRDGSGNINFNAIGCTAISASGQINTTAASPLGVSVPNGDSTALRFAVTNFGSNILIQRKNVSLANTVDIQAINSFNLKIYTDGGVLTLGTSDVLGSSNSAATILGTGSVVNGTAGVLTATGGNASGSGTGGAGIFGGGTSSTGLGGVGTLQGGNGGTGGLAIVKGGNSSTTSTKGGHAAVVPGFGSTGSGGFLYGCTFLGANPTDSGVISGNIGARNLVIPITKQLPNAGVVSNCAIVWCDNFGVYVKLPDGTVKTFVLA